MNNPATSATFTPLRGALLGLLLIASLWPILAYLTFGRAEMISFDSNTLNFLVAGLGGVGLTLAFLVKSPNAYLKGLLLRSSATITVLGLAGILGLHPAVSVVVGLAGGVMIWHNVIGLYRGRQRPTY